MADSLKRLKDGNRRFVLSRSQASVDHERREELAAGQNPFAIILGCSDSRVPAEIIFDQGLGDLFVIRIAGNIVAPSIIGSVEFAADRFGTDLVVVLGHTQCGAILATLEDLDHPSPNLKAIVDRIKPGLERLDRSQPKEYLIASAIRANIQASVEQLKDGSDILQDLIASGKLKIIGAEYSLETGVVQFFE